MKIVILSKNISSTGQGMKSKLQFSLFLLMICSLANATSLGTEGAIATIGEWKIYKNTVDGVGGSCVAKHISYPGVTLSPKKLVVSSKATKDLKSYQVEIDGQETIAFRRADISDLSCGCIRIRQLERFSSNSSSFHLAGLSEQGKNVEFTATLNDIPSVLEAFKKADCAR